MLKNLTHAVVLVHDQDEALEFYTQKLGFVKRLDLTGEDFRWLEVAPSAEESPAIVLTLATTDEEKAHVGDQTGGRYSLFVLTTDDCQTAYEQLKANGVTVIGEPMDNPWGLAVQFKDLYGNQFELVQPKGW